MTNTEVLTTGLVKPSGTNTQILNTGIAQSRGINTEVLRATKNSGTNTEFLT